MQINIQSTSTFAIIDTCGAELKSVLDVTNTEYVWQADEKYWNRSSPLLFPNVGCLKDNKTIINGKEYQLPQHGFVRDMEFRVLMQSDDRVTLAVTDTPETLKMYPFKFMIQVTYEIHDCVLDIKYKVMNTDDETMYYCIGAHPGFNVPMVEGEEFSDYRITFAENETVHVPVFNKETKMFDDDNRKTMLDNEKTMMINYDMFKNDAILFDTIKSKSIQIDSIKTGRGVKVNFDKFEQVAVWTPNNINAPFVCIEPWCGSADFSDEDGIFEHKRGVQVLEGLETRVHSLSIILL